MADDWLNVADQISGWAALDSYFWLILLSGKSLQQTLGKKITMSEFNAVSLKQARKQTEKPIIN